MESYDQSTKQFIARTVFIINDRMIKSCYYYTIHPEDYPDLHRELCTSDDDEHVHFRSDNTTICGARLGTADGMTGATREAVILAGDFRGLGALAPPRGVEGFS